MAENQICLIPREFGKTYFSLPVPGAKPKPLPQEEIYVKDCLSEKSNKISIHNE